MRRIINKQFKYSQLVVDFINEHNIKQEDIQAISTGRNWITLYYWINEK